MKTKTHRPFVAEVIGDLHQHAPDTLERYLFVFPTQISIDYFQQLFDKTLPMPVCLTLHQLMLAHSAMEEAPPIVLLGELHALTNQILRRQLAFEQFYAFGTTLLEDFHCLDQYLINVPDFFLTLLQQKQLTVPLAVQSFINQDPLDHQATDYALFQQQAIFWEKLPLLYQAFTQKLLQEGKGYSGLCYRIAAGRALSEPFAQQMVFVGFNLLTPAEEAFIIQCQARMPVKFYWDIDAHYMDNVLNAAGYYLRQHRQKKHFQACFPAKPMAYLDDACKEVVVTEMYTTMAEIQSVVEALQTTTEAGKPKFLPTQTAIVISGSQLLMPLLDKLDRLAIPLHFRLNYPLGATVMFRLVAVLAERWMQNSGSSVDMGNNWAAIWALMRSLVGNSEEVTAILQDGFHKGLWDYLQDGLTFMEHYFIRDPTLFLDLNRTALQYILAYIISFRAVAGTHRSLSFFLNTLKESMMPFHQYNPEGLYIVEVAQADNLDFEHLFFINMREGHFPPLSPSDSFLPYNLRKRFGLPLLDKEAERVTAYGFYRLLGRASHCYCSYAKQNYLGYAHEMSRLILQISFDSKLKIIQQAYSIDFSLGRSPLISITKDAKIMEWLEKFLVKENDSPTSSLTPSALITYMSCPLQFYFAYLLQLKPTGQRKDEALQLGMLFHDVMERLYRPFVDKQVDASIVRQLASKIKKEVEAVLRTQEQDNPTYRLLSALLEKILERMLALDAAATPFTLLGVEQEQRMAIHLDGKRKVALRGIIDRIDFKGNTIRIIDYKTGRSYDRIAHMAALFDRKAIKKNKAVFQIFLYAWLFKSADIADDHPIMPYLINIRELFSDSYSPGIAIQQLRAIKPHIHDTRVVDMGQHVEAFEAGLVELLVEIFDPAIPFSQTEDREVCAYCPYVTICQRD